MYINSLKPVESMIEVHGDVVGNELDCEKIVNIKDGKKGFETPVKELYNHKTFEKQDTPSTLVLRKPPGLQGNVVNVLEFPDVAKFGTSPMEENSVKLEAVQESEAAPSRKNVATLEAVPDIRTRGRPGIGDHAQEPAPSKRV